MTKRKRDISSNVTMSSTLSTYCNLYSEKLDAGTLTYRLYHSYPDKNIFIKLESLSIILDSYVEQNSKENFYKYMRSSVTIITKNVPYDRDNTFKSLYSLRKTENIVIYNIHRSRIMHSNSV